jgi:hypothetical protein
MVSVKWGSINFEVEPELLSGLMSAKELRQSLALKSGLPCEQFKLIRSGRLIMDDTWLASTDKVTMMGSKSSIDGATDRLVRDDMTDSKVKRKYAISLKLRSADPKFIMRSDYTFHKCEALPDFADRDKALSLLNELANDPGVLHVLEKRKWSVGCLREMYPEGLVGVSDVCVLGLNRNKGEEILLRLRTDDLKGFRKLLSIKKVLYHELAHNEFGDHDGSFYMLMREIEAEATSLSWLNSRSNRVSEDWHRPSRNDGSPPTEEHAVNILGGSASLVPTREAAALAAELRGYPICLPCSNTILESMSKSALPDISPQVEHASIFTPLVDAPSQEESKASVDYGVESGSVPESGDKAVEAAVLLRVDEALAHVFMLTDAHVLERLAAMRTALLIPLARLARARLEETLDLAHLIVHNARTSPDQRHQRINRTNRRFQR